MSLDGALDISSKVRADDGVLRTCIDGLIRYAFGMARTCAAFELLPGVASTEPDVDVSKLSMSVLLSCEGLAKDGLLIPFEAGGRTSGDGSTCINFNGRDVLDRLAEEGCMASLVSEFLLEVVFVLLGVNGVRFLRARSSENGFEGAMEAERIGRGIGASSRPPCGR